MIIKSYKTLYDAECKYYVDEGQPHKIQSFEKFLTKRLIERDKHIEKLEKAIINAQNCLK
jgi:hypothetical protein